MDFLELVFAMVGDDWYAYLLVVYSTRAIDLVRLSLSLSLSNILVL